MASFSGYDLRGDKAARAQSLGQKTPLSCIRCVLSVAASQIKSVKTEPTLVMAVDGDVLCIAHLSKASLEQLLCPRSCYSGGGGLDLDLPDRMMATLRAVLLPGGIILE
jgi:hypothetical protein